MDNRKVYLLAELTILPNFLDADMPVDDFAVELLLDG
jgi:hypothetical protein